MLEIIKKMNDRGVILASQSPRRKKLLAQIGLIFKIVVPIIDEDDHPHLSDPAAMVSFLSLQKALQVSETQKHNYIIAADTTVSLKGHVLNKPQNHEHAHRMLSLLSGQTHVVHTGYTLIAPDSTTLVNRSVQTRVTFSPLSDDEINQYILTGSPMDKAGAYGIQDDIGAAFIERIEGDYYNVVGFPLNDFYREIRKRLI